MKPASLYLHIPFCKSKCIYCDFYSVAGREDEISVFTQALITEINLAAKGEISRLEIDTVYLGGGTPSLLDPAGIEQIFSAIRNTFKIRTSAEITIEANPGEMEKNTLQAFRDQGVNRLSMGFQSFQPELLNFLSRIHSPEDCQKSYDLARLCGFNNINADLIFDIPGQSIKTWENDLTRLIKMGPEHISAYSLTVEEETPLHGLVQSGRIKMRSDDQSAEFYLLTQDILQESGYGKYEISNYARSGRKCRHNLAYWQFNPYLGFGPSAHSYNGKSRWWNVRSVSAYISDLKAGKLPVENREILKPHDHFNERIYNGLRTAEGVDLNSLSEYYSGTIENWVSQALSRWQGLEKAGNYLRLKPEATLLTDETSADLFHD